MKNENQRCSLIDSTHSYYSSAKDKVHRVVLFMLQTPLKTSFIVKCDLCEYDNSSTEGEGG